MKILFKDNKTRKTYAKEIIMDIDDCPNLKRYYEHFSATNGEAEMPGYLPCLIIWIMLSIEDAENEELFSIPKFFEMDYETKIEFYSWGTTADGRMYSGNTL